MELVSRAKEALHDVAERAAGYQIGQTALKYLDHTLWVVENCSKWAVPPPLDQDERDQPELVRPLPWVFFLMMLVTLRVTRESISLLNLVMGKPPLRSADVVMYIQSRRRYVRTLQYLGARALRARPQPHAYTLRSLLHFAMCFRRHSLCANNNTAEPADTEQVLVVKRSKRGRETPSPVVSANESTMERLIEKMMVDLDADSDEDSSYTLTNVSPKSERSDVTAVSDQDTSHKNAENKRSEQEPVSNSQSTQTLPTAQNNTQNAQTLPTAQKNTQSTQIRPTAQNDPVLPTAQNTQNAQVLPTTKNNQIRPTAQNDPVLPTAQNTQKPQVLPTAKNNTQSAQVQPTAQNKTQHTQVQSTTEKDMQVTEEKVTEPSSVKKNDDTTPTISDNNDIGKDYASDEAKPPVLSAKDETQLFLQIEASSKIPRTSNSEQKIVNGRTKSVPSKKKGHMKEKDRRNSERLAGNMSPHNSF